MSIKTTIRNILALAVNILLAYVAYTVCRLLFVWTNDALFHNLSGAHLLDLLKAGVVFDSSAICYTNAIIILMFLLPLHWKERRGYYAVARVLYVLINGVCIVANLCDVVYYPFTGKRTTMSVLQEFANEDAGNMANVFIEHALANWWLIIAGVAMIVGLWFGFRNPIKKKKRDRYSVRYVSDLTERPSAIGLIGYYSGQLVALCAIGYLCVGAMRGGFTTATRPITISNANQYIDAPSEAGIVLNTPFSLIRTYGKKPFIVPDYMSEEEANGLYSAEHKAQTTTAEGCCDSMNVVVLILESFSKQHIGFYNIQHDENGASGDKHTFTPFLDSLLNHSLTFRYSYSNGRKSIEGMPSVLSSIPNFVEPFFLTPASMNTLSGLARELSENKGYTSAFFHGAANGSMGFEAFAKATGFQQYFGRTEYNDDPRYHGDDDFDGTWAIWDEEFLQFYADKMSEMREPFITSVFTASSHTPFRVPSRYEGRFAEGKMPLQRCVAYSDYALRRFFNKAKKQPWFSCTLFVITSDHTSSHFDPFYTTTLGNNSVPIAFYAPSIDELTGYNDSTIVEQIDIMPTVLGLLGYDKPYIAFGQDILSTPSKDKFALHWLPETNSYEFLHGDYLMQFDGEKTTAVYKFRTDKQLRRNLSPTLPHDSIAHSEQLMKAIIQQYMWRMNNNKLIY